MSCLQMRLLCLAPATSRSTSASQATMTAALHFTLHIEVCDRCHSYYSPVLSSPTANTGSTAQHGSGTMPHNELDIEHEGVRREGLGEDRRGA